jgi:hypothetical protein
LIFRGHGELVCGLADYLEEKKSAVITFRKNILKITGNGTFIIARLI